MPCNRYIPGMKLTLGRHDLVHDVYVMDLPDTNIILGVQWLSTLGPITTNYKTMEMSFTEESGRKVVLRGMTINIARVVTTKKMEAIFRREDIVYIVECNISTRVDKRGRFTMHQRSRGSLTNTVRCLDPFHQECHQIGDLSISLSWKRGQSQSSPHPTDTQRSTRTR